MKTELLIIKNNDDYIKIEKNQYICCSLDKASVFPVDEIRVVREHISRLKESGFDDASVYKLVLTETPFED